jgi:hypothetical protein
VKRLAHRAVLLVNGQVAAEGHPSDVVNRYVGLVLERQRAAQGEEPERRMSTSFRHGDGASRIEDVTLLDRAGAPSMAFTSGDSVTVRVRVRFEREVDEPVLGILIRNRLGIDVFGTNTRIEQRRLGSFHSGDVLELDFRFDCLLTRQEYTLTVATQYWDGSSQDWLDDVLAFSVVDPKEIAGLASLRTDIEWRRLGAAGN